MDFNMTLTNKMPERMSTGMVHPLQSDAWSCLSDHQEGAALYKHFSYPIVFIYPIGREKSTCRTIEVIHSGWESGYVPRTALGKRLLALRRKAIAAGMRLLSEAEILEEVKRRRGELTEDETDLY